MEYTHLGRSGLSVSRLCLGTMNFGPLTPPAEAEAIMDHAHDIGINFFDTANRYGGVRSPPGQLAQDGQAHPGWTEEIIGNWFATGGGRRDRTVPATKLYGAMGDWPHDGKLSALNIRRSCDASLRRLRTDYIDLYQMHQALERHRDQIEAFEALCDELGEQPAHVALAWLLHQEGITGPIIGPRTEDQLDDALHAVTLRLDEDVLKRIDEIFPGYQPAPEHYAW